MRSTVVASGIVSVGMVLSAALLMPRAGAGPLNPPAGPVASTYKTLAEVEPRIAISATNTPGDADSLFRIAQPGSYYLTGNVSGVAGKHAIKIDADGVTLDLGGFTLQGVPGSLDGVNVVGARAGLTVSRGTVRDFGDDGVDAVSATVSRFVDLSLISNADFGVDIGGGSVAERCLASGHANAGIRANNGASVFSCTASGNPGDGIICGAGTVRDCVARGNGFDGIRGNTGCVITQCVATANVEGGIALIGYGSAIGNTCAINGWGLYTFGVGNNRIENNTVSANTTAIELFNDKNVVVGNFCDGPIIAVPGNVVGPVVTGATVGGSSNPHANYSN